MPSKSEFLSQAFFKDRDLVASLIERSSIGRGDTVLEIDPGIGIITDELLKRAGKVIAVEKDPDRFQGLQRRYRENPRLELHNADILNFNLPQIPYKVFSNTPFLIESQLIHRMIDHPTHPFQY